MQYKPDLDTIIPRMEAWWNRELLDRVCISVHAPNGRPRREVAAPESIRERYTNADYLFESTEARIDATYYGGEAIPIFQPDLGPDTFAACLGVELEYYEDTSWARPVEIDWANPPSFDIDETSFAWNWYVDTYRAAAERARGRYFIAGPDCHSGGDCLLAMRGGTNLVLDLYDYPEAIQAAMDQLGKAVVRFHDTFFGIIESSGQRGHTTGTFAVWSPGRSNNVQLDLLALINPAQFERFFYREVEIQSEMLGNAVFHLDGPDAIKHLPKLYELFERDRNGALACIQWVPGAGSPPMIEWLPLLKEMQARGINLHVSCGAGEVETFMRELSSKGLFLATWGESREAADETIALAAKLTHDRHAGALVAGTDRV